MIQCPTHIFTCKKRKHNPHEGLHTNDHNSFVCNSQKHEVNQMPMNRRMDKQSRVYPSNAMLLSNKMNELLIHTTPWMNLKIHTLSETSQNERVHSV